MQYEEMLAEEVENHETLFTCNGKPKVIDDEVNCQYCECTDCKHWNEFNKRGEN